MTRMSWPKVKLTNQARYLILAHQQLTELRLDLKIFYRLSVVDKDT